MNRPYFQDSFYDLERLFNSSKDNPRVLKTLLNELNHRSTDFACALRNEVEDCLKNLEETFKQCLKVAEQGDAGVQFIVGYAYRSGKGVEKDDGLTLL